MDIREHVIDGKTRLHVIVGDPIAQVKLPLALTPLLLARGHKSDVRAARAAACATSTEGQMHASQQQMLVDYMLGN